MIWLGILAAYLVGAIPFGLIVARIRGVDLLSQGSGNIGATNVGRVLGAKWGLLVFLLDFLKGSLPAFAGSFFLAQDWGKEISGIALGAAAIIGHIFPLYLGFKGGKGVATGAGVMAVLVPIPLILSLLTWLAVVAGWRMVSLGSLAASGQLALIQAGLAWRTDSNGVWALAFFSCAATAFVWIKHRANLGRLLTGTENKLKDSFLWNFVERYMTLSPLALWLGGGLFFTAIIGPGVFSWFEEFCLSPERPFWLPLPEELSRPATEGLPNPLAKEQASRLAGIVVSHIFPIYYFTQVFLGLLTLLVLMGAVHRSSNCKGLRWVLRLVATAWMFALAGWALEIKVRQNHQVRTELVDQLIKEKDPKANLVAQVMQARKQFGVSHGMSLLLNMGALAFLFFGYSLALGCKIENPASTP